MGGDCVTKNEKILSDLLIQKGFMAKDICYYPTFGYQDGGWIATIIEKDEFGDEIDESYQLGRNFLEAKRHIENYEILRL